MTDIIRFKRSGFTDVNESYGTSHYGIKHRDRSPEVSTKHKPLVT